MPDGNGQQVFFIDDELVERLMRGDAPETSSKAKRPAGSSALASAVKLAGAGRLDDAVKELEGAAAQGENPIEIQSGLGHLRFEQKRWEDAERCYRKVTETDANHAAARYNLGLTLERQSRFEEAAQAFETAAQLDPKRWQSETGRGMCLVHLGKSDVALECFNRALANGPAQDRTLFGKAVALHQLGRL